MRVFVSYRRDDSSAYAGRLRDSLADRLGASNVFQDVSTITPGEDFRRAIERSLDLSEATLVVIGPGWLSAADVHGVRRLDQPTDYVRIEIAEALTRELRVVPVLVGGAPLPGSNELPDGLQPLAERQAVVIHDETWHEDVDGLVRALRPAPAARRKRWWLVAAAAAVLAVAAAVLALVLRNDDDDPGVADPGDATFPAVMGPCPGFNLSGWTALDIPSEATADVPSSAGGSWVFAVEEAEYRPRAEEWDVLLAVNATNETGDVQYQDFNFYALALDRVQYEPRCISVIAGADPVGIGGASDVLVGFVATRDPGGSNLALNLEVPGGTASIGLSPVS